MFDCSLSQIQFQQIREYLTAIDSPNVFTLAQGLFLALAAKSIGAEVAIDLGTGAGNSACVLSTVCPVVHTIGYDSWSESLAVPSGVTRHTADIAGLDFRPLIGEARSVLVFWDAHGFDIAERVLSHLMPLIADRRHIVVCHDICDNRNGRVDLSYGGKRMWRGMADCYGSADEFAYANIGWASTIVDQLVPIMDFCRRNEIELRSADDDFAALPEQQRRDIAGLLQTPSPFFFIAHFSMNETKARNFPADPSLLGDASCGNALRGRERIVEINRHSGAQRHIWHLMHVARTRLRRFGLRHFERLHRGLRRAG